LLDPEQGEVFVLDFELILREDGAEKNDCERQAAHRLSEQLYRRFPRLPMQFEYCWWNQGDPVLRGHIMVYVTVCGAHFSF
jgi:hypothetical protein